MGHAMRLRTISDSGFVSTAPELGGRTAWNGRNRRADRKVQALSRVPAGPGDLEDLEGVDQSEVFAGAGVAVSTPQRQRHPAEGGENLGSGFIVDQRGLIVTNFHLISNTESRSVQATSSQQPKKGKLADRVWVTLSDGRQFSGSVKGYDEATDIALLEIVPTGNCPA